MVPVLVEKRDVYRIAAEADVDDRTVERFLDGQIAKRNSRARGRICQAMHTLGLAEYIPRFEVPSRGGRRK